MEQDPAIVQQMMTLGVEGGDVATVFDLMDTSGTGEVPYKDLVTSIHRLQSHDPLQSTIVNMKIFKRLHDHLLHVLGADLRVAGHAAEDNKTPNEETPMCDPCHSSKLVPMNASTDARKQNMLVESLSASVACLTQDCALKVTQLTELTKDSARELGRHSTFLASITDILTREHLFDFSQAGTVNATERVYSKGTSSTERTPSTLLAEISHLHYLGTELILILREAQEQLATQKLLAEPLRTCVRKPGRTCSAECDFIDEVVQQERMVLQRTL